MQPKGPAVLITGASSGIGLACARRLEEAGFRVFAGCRRLPEPPGPGTAVPLEVTDSESVARAVRAVEAAAPEGLAGLVNNAGIVVAGPLEFLPLGEVRRQFEVNVFGALAVTQAFLPLLRRARGRVVLMSSVSGLVATPFLGPYAASKFALEALGDALRMELSPWGLEVAIVEPGSTATPLWEKSRRDARRTLEGLPPEARALYGDALGALEEASRRVEARGVPPEAVARAVLHALCARRPRTRYRVGADTRFQASFLRALPDRWRDRLILRRIGRPPGA